jgi:SRSO17 transposase
MEFGHDEVEKELKKLTGRLVEIFLNQAGFGNKKKYISGFLVNIERKNSWQLVEYLGESTPYAMQQLLYGGRFSADELKNELRDDM